MRRTILIGTNVLEKPQIEPWSMVVHWDAVPQTGIVSYRRRGNGSPYHIACNLSRSLFSPHLR